MSLNCKTTPKKQHVLITAAYPTVSHQNPIMSKLVTFVCSSERILLHVVLLSCLGVLKGFRGCLNFERTGGKTEHSNITLEQESVRE